MWKVLHEGDRVEKSVPSLKSSSKTRENGKTHFIRGIFLGKLARTSLEVFKKACACFLPLTSTWQIKKPDKWLEIPAAATFRAQEKKRNSNVFSPLSG